MTIQTVLFDKKFWSESKAHNYLLKHHLKNNGVDDKEHYLRFRQVEPDSTKRYYTKKIKGGVEYVFMY